MSMKRVFILGVTKVLVLVFTLSLGSIRALGQAAAPQTGGVALYRELLNPAFNAQEVYQVREVSIMLEDMHISISDGTIAFVREINGRITGAMFEGVGEILLVPPNRAERTSLALFTGSAVLEQRFQSAYLRFADDKIVNELKSGLRGHAENAEEFITRWQQPALLLARGDALPILQAMTSAPQAGARFLHLRIGGTTAGIVDLFFDSNAAEQISVAQANVVNNVAYYDTWTSFPMRSIREASGQEDPAARATFEVSDYKLRVNVQPPTDLSAEAEFTLTPQRSGQRTLILELSRYLKLSEVRVNGAPAEFIQNEAITGSDLSRRGDDLIGIVMPAPLEKGHPVKLQFKYSGPVMFDAGNDVIYVGARGTWYPNIGATFSNFDLTFECPSSLPPAPLRARLKSMLTAQGPWNSRWRAPRRAPARSLIPRARRNRLPTKRQTRSNFFPLSLILFLISTWRLRSFPDC
jgi:hypothetical protein